MIHSSVFNEALDEAGVTGIRVAETETGLELQTGELTTEAIASKLANGMVRLYAQIIKERGLRLRRKLK